MVAPTPFMLSMDFQFTVGDLALDKQEATLISSLVNKPIMISLDKYLKNLDHTQIYQAAVETQNPRLASLAVKLAMHSPKELATSKKRAYRYTGANSIEKTKVEPVDPFDAMEEILSLQSLKGVGAAMILSSLQDGKSKQLKEIACDSVNHLSDFMGCTPDNSGRLFRGFSKSMRGWMPVETKKKDRTGYHHGSVYTCMREGLRFLKARGLAEVEPITVKGGNGGGHQLERKVFTCKLSKTGLKLVSNWSDIDEFVSLFWQNNPHR